MSAAYDDDCMPRGEWPTFVVVDPFGQIRGTTSGYRGTAELKSLVMSGWADFIAEHPSWVSPRCAGVAGERTLCPCADPAPHGGELDADADGVRDACDTCASGNDRMDLDNDGIADACDDTPGYQGREPVVITEVTVQALFGFDGEETIQGWTLDGNPQKAFVRVSVKTANAGNCSFTRALDAPTTVSIREDLQTSGEVGGPPRTLLGWDFSAGSSITGVTLCDERLDLPLRGDAFVEELLSTNWGVVILDSCAVEGCARRDELIWELYGCAAGSSDPACQNALGASVWFGDSGILLSDTQEVAAAATATAYASSTSLELPSGFDAVPISLPPSRSTLPRGVYSIYIGLFPEDFYERFLPNLARPGN